MRNTESRFATNPTNLNMSRSTFKRDSSVKTTWNVGDLIPFYCEEVLPGDTFSVDTSKVVRLQTLKTPILDDIFLDTYYFFVPNRLVWSHWKEFMGENTNDIWTPSVEYSVPQLSAPSGGWKKGTIADYFGIPTDVSGFSVNALPFRAYALIYNDWFQNENVVYPSTCQIDDINRVGVNGDLISDQELGGMPRKVSKLHDYFTSALPAPQKGPDVYIPTSGGSVPVWTGEDHHTSMSSGDALRWTGVSGFPNNNGGSPLIWADSFAPSGTSSNGTTAYNGFNSNKTTYYSDLKSVAPSNLWADLASVPSATVNQLRQAFAVQRFYEKSARGGSRYIESIHAHFSVTSPDARLQRSEYLGGNRQRLNISQIIQQSSDTSSQFLGDTGAMSCTTDFHHDFTKSFTEHGYIIGLMVARYNHTYTQGLNRMWSRKNTLDFYFPTFANIGEQPVLNKELFLQNDNVVDGSGVVVNNKAFGYQEAWAEYRYKPSIATGEMRPTYAQALDMWHLADEYTSLPTLSEGWMLEDKSNVDRVIQVTSSVSDQLFGDIFIANKCTRCMPLYSVPGLLDHN